MQVNKIIRYGTAVLLTAFALLTLFLSSSVILNLFGVRAMEGNYVLSVVWANFFSSLLYLLAAYGFLKARSWTYGVLALSFFVLLTGSVAFALHINAGGLYEEKTIGALFFRSTLTLIFTLIAFLTTRNKNERL